MKPGDLVKFRHWIGIWRWDEWIEINEGAVGIFINHFETGGRQYSNILVEGMGFLDVLHPKHGITSILRDVLEAV